MARKLMAGALAALALTMSAVGVAQADTIYPLNANSFAGDTENWRDAGHTCGLGPLPLGQVTPLLCEVKNEYAGSQGNPPGSIRTQYTAAAGLLGLITGTGVWESPTFTVIANPVPTGATFALDRKADIQGAINVGGSVAYTVDLVDTSDPTHPMTVSKESLTSSDTNFVHKPGPAAFSVVAGHQYFIRITSTMTSILQAALQPVSVYFDNIQLRVADGTGDHITKAGATTLSPTEITANSATLNGAVNSYAEQTYYQFEWGETTNYGNLTPRFDGGKTSGPITRSFSLSQANGVQLKPCTTYHYRVRAANTINTSTPQTDITRDSLGNDVEFSTFCAPEAHTLDATGVTATSAFLNSTIDPNGPKTSYHYEIGFTNAYGFNTPERDAGEGDGARGPNSEPVGGLKPSTTYHYRVVAKNSLGASIGEDKVITTPAQSGPGPQGPAGPAGPQGPQGDDGASGSDTGEDTGLLRLRSFIARVGTAGSRAGQIRLPIFCSKRTGRTCAGTVKIRTTNKINPSSLGRNKAKRRVTLATFEYQLLQGKKGYAIATIQPEKLRLMRRLKSVAVEISVTVTDNQGNRETVRKNGRMVAQRTV